MSAGDRRVGIRGVGTSDFGSFPERRIEELGWAAATEALDDAGIAPDDVELAFVGSVFGAPGLANRVLAGVGLGGVPAFAIEAACASGTVALHEAYEAVRSGRCRVAIALGVEQLSTQFSGPIVPEPSDPEGRTGLAMPALYALQAERYLQRHDVHPDLLAHVAVKNKSAGALNPRAHLGDRAPTLDDVLESRPIAGPLTLLQCCPMSDGAGAAIVTAYEPGDVEILSSERASGTWWTSGSEEPWGFETVRDTARRALDTADVRLDDVDVFEVHDAFTIGEVLTVEAIGLAEPGQGAELAAAGHTAIGGRSPVNPSGGLLSRGHPLGATGLAQTAELVWQLRGEAGDRQVEGAQVAMLETMGGGAAGVDANACVIALLRGPEG
ncbi:MAG: thiolase family protein [Actinomycetota bacterium]